jgi:hypothetical protein
MSLDGGDFWDSWRRGDTSRTYGIAGGGYSGIIYFDRESRLNQFLV